MINVPRTYRAAKKRTKAVETTKLLIWFYLGLLLAEGALRKWALPQLSTPLLLIRDPLMIAIIWKAAQIRDLRMKRLWPLIAITAVMITLAAIQIALGVDTVPIAIYGLRSYLLHLPLALIVREVFTFEDVKKIGKFLMLAAIPMTALMAAQYRAPSDSWLNAGAGEKSVQMASAGDHVRASATFSFGNGVVCFFPLVLAFLLYALVRPRAFPKWVVLSSAVATALALPLSGSRTLLFTTIVMIAVAIIPILRTPTAILRTSSVLLVFILVAAASIQLPILRDSITTFQDRWTEASRAEGDINDVLALRLFGVITGGLDSAQRTNWIGQGIGMGSNIAAYLQTGSQQFLLAEMEWERVVMELGPLVGLGFMLFRTTICADLVLSAFRSMRRGSELAWLLMPATVPFLLIHSMEQPTNLGFMVIGVGLCLASSKSRLPSPQELRPTFQAAGEINVAVRRLLPSTRQHNFGGY